MVELVGIFHHGQTSLLQIQELRELPVQNTHRNEILSEGSGELLPCHPVVHLLHGIEGIPPSAGRSLQLLCGEAHLLLIGHCEQQELLL
jgi:hypothetical protein